MPDGHSRAVVVVNNGGTLPEKRIQRICEVQIVQPGTNLGYANGCSRGIQAAREHLGHHPEWWVVSNTDIQIEPSFFQRLFRTTWPESVALLSPDVREARGWPRNPFHRQRPSRRWMRRRLRLLSSSLLTIPYIQAARWKRMISRPPSVPASAVPIYATHGSLLVIHRRFFERGGTLSYEGFLYGEEIHVAEQVRRMGLRIRWSPSLRAFHQQGTSLGRVSLTKQRRWRRESYKFLYRAYFQADA